MRASTTRDRVVTNNGGGFHAGDQVAQHMKKKNYMQPSVVFVCGGHSNFILQIILIFKLGRLARRRDLPQQEIALSQTTLRVSIYMMNEISQPEMKCICGGTLLERTRLAGNIIRIQ